MKKGNLSKYCKPRTTLPFDAVRVWMICAMVFVSLAACGSRAKGTAEGEPKKSADLGTQIEKRIPEGCAIGHVPPPTPPAPPEISRRTFTELSRQFDADLEIAQYEDSVLVCVSMYGKKLQQRTDHTIVFRYNLFNDEPFDLGVWWYTDPEYGCNDVTSYSTGHNAGREISDNYFGVLVVADLNFDGRDDIAMVSGSAVTNGPFYTFLTQTAEGGFVEDRFLTEEMTYFPGETDPSLRTLTTYSPASSVDVVKRVFELDTATNEWKMIVHELLP